MKYNFYDHFLTIADSRRGVVSYRRKYGHLAPIKPHNYTNGTLELSFFVIISFIRKDKQGKICLQKFTTFCVDITFWYILTFNAKCCKLLTSSVFVVRFVNDIVDLQLSFL